MNEKVLAESKRGILGRICLILFILSVIMGISVSITSGGKALLPVLVAYIVPTGLLALLTAPVEMTVTTERVYGTGSWGKKVDLPIDTISSISSSILGGIIIGTSSGRIKFAGLGNKKRNLPMHQRSAGSPAKDAHRCSTAPGACSGQRCR